MSDASRDEGVSAAAGTAANGRFLPFCLGAFAVALAASAFMLWVPHPRHGLSERLQGGAIVFVVMGLFVGAVYMRTRKLARDADAGQAGD